MFEVTERQQNIIKKFVKIVLIILFVLLFITKILPYIAPFVVAILMTFVIERPVQFMQKRLKMPRSLAVALAIVLFVTVIGGIVIFSFYQLTAELSRLTKDTPSLYYIADLFETLIEKSQNFYLKIPEEIVKSLEKNIGTIVSTISSWLTRLFGSMLDMAKSLPELFIFLVVSIVSTFFMSRDREKVAAFVYRQLPSRWEGKLRGIKSDLIMASVGYLKAQLTLLVITFLELLLGFTILGVDYAFFLAIFTAIIDAIPVLGTGTILIPVSAAHLVMGNSSRAFAFFMLYIVILMVRQFLEPRIIGGNLGVHPLVMLIAIYVGMKVFGVAGLILGPVFVIIGKALQKSGLIAQFK